MSKPRFECDTCGADQETVRYNGEGCGAMLCQDCLKRHESQCVERNGDRTSCDSQRKARSAFQRGHSAPSIRHHSKQTRRA